MSVQKLLFLEGDVLRPFPDLGTLEYLGSKRLKTMNEAGIFDIADLLLRIPRRYEDRRKAKNFFSLYQNQGKGRVYTRIRVVKTEFFYMRGKRTPKIWVEDDSGTASLLCFGRPFLANKLVQGSSWLLAGSFFLRRGDIQASSFEVFPEAEAEQFFRIDPVYSPLPAIYPGILRKIYTQALGKAEGLLLDTLPREELRKNGLPEIGWAIEHIHRPECQEDIEKARRRLAYAELRRMYRDQHIQRRVGAKPPPSERGQVLLSPLQQSLVNSLNFSLTADQQNCVGEINADLAHNSQMYRLLQGDVGSGKTLVALLAALWIVEQGGQVALMVPTEILAFQHLEKMEELRAEAGSPVALYLCIAAMKEGEKTTVRNAMQAGKPGIWLGTHSLFSRDVQFSDLRLVIIDEQHRFGVNQREQLRSKSLTDRVLMLSATPIPRTLTLTLFGNTDISTIRTMPAGRLPVRTHLAAMGKEEKVYREVEKDLANGQQAYFVYPRIEESEEEEGAEDEGASREKKMLKSAEQMFTQLKERFAAYSVGIVHGRQSMDERQSEMKAFIAGDRDILVATTVIEVGVDVPNASVMVVEHAERFGLAALHQLRGRVGRGAVQSHCYLVYDPALSDDGKERMRVMKEHSDGFALAEADLRIRGPGSIAGMEQSGYLNLEFASLYNDIDLVEALAKTLNAPV